MSPPFAVLIVSGFFSIIVSSSVVVVGFVIGPATAPASSVTTSPVVAAVGIKVVTMMTGLFPSVS